MSLDATTPTDVELVSAIPEYIRDNRTAINTLYRNVDAQDSTVEFTVADLNQIYTVDSAVAVVLTLPAVTADEVGTWFRVHKMGVGDLTITPNAVDAIAAGIAGATLANTAAEALTAFIELECVAAGQWVIAGRLGTWA